MYEMFKTLLFDLDNTLLEINENEFLDEYARYASQYFLDLMTPERFKEKLIESTGVMMRNNGNVDNVTAFTLHFIKDLPGISAEEVTARFTRFYIEKFDEIKRITRPIKKAKQVILRAVEIGYEIVIATNPVFPTIALEKRIKWAGLDDIPIMHITSGNEYHFCKPRKEYFVEILEKIKRTANDCLMIGNDFINDMAASLAGITTFWLNNITNKDEIRSTPKKGLKKLIDLEKIVINYKGNFDDLMNIIEQNAKYI